MRGPSRRRALGSRLLRQDKTGPEHQGLRYRQPENRLWLRRGRADLDLDLGDGGYDVRGADLFVRPLRALLVYGFERSRGDRSYPLRSQDSRSHARGLHDPRICAGSVRRQRSRERCGGAWRFVRLAHRGHHQHQGHLSRCLQRVWRRSAACRDHGLVVVLIYSMLGGLWASVTTSALSTLLHTVPSAIILAAALHYAGGVDAVWHSVAAQGNGLLTVTRPDAAIGFGITLALGLLTATIAGQEFWQVAWALKKKDVSRSFLWAGAWFYPIPICLGLLGLIGLALHVDVNSQLGGDAAAIGPLLVSHLGLPTWLVILYVIVILSACYSVIDSAFTATSSVFVVDIIKPLAPHITERSLYAWATAPMFLAAAIAAAVVLTGVDFVTIVLTSYAIRTAILIPLALSLFWSRMTGLGFFAGTVLAIAIGMPIRAATGDLWGSLSILAISAIVPIAISLAGNRRYDFARLSQVRDATIVAPAE